MFDSRRTEKSDYRRTDRSFTLGGLFHWLSTNNQLSLLFVVNQRIFVRLHSPAWWPVRLEATRYYLASIFGTLLSSQGSDAHQRFAHRARRRGWYPCRSAWQRSNCSNLPASLLGRQIRDPLCKRPDKIALGSLRGAHSSTLGRRLQLGLRGHRSGPGSLSGSGISSRDRPAWGWVVTHPLGVRSSLSG